MSLYSYNGEWPQQLPNRIILSNGRTRTDKSSFTSEEIADAGWTAVANPPMVEYPNKLDWDKVNFAWIVRPPNSVETEAQWRIVRETCVSLLEETDYKVLKAYEQGISVSVEVVNYRQGIRDIFNNVNNIDPWNVPWPVRPITVDNPV